MKKTAINLGFIASLLLSGQAIYATNTSLCVYNNTNNTLGIQFNDNNEVQELLSLSSTCKDNLSKDDVKINIAGQTTGTIISKQKDSDGLSNSKSNVNINNKLSYDLQTGNWTNTYTIFDPKKPQVITTKNWMSKISGAKKINQLVIPGSHDAGMSKTENCSIGVKSSDAKTQQLDLYGQLMAGARYFDIRIDYDHKKLVTFHRSMGFGCNGQTLINYGSNKGLLEEIIKFLKENPSETVFLKFSHTRNDGSHSAKETVKKIIDLLKNNSQINQYLYKSNIDQVNISNLSLDSLRGKMVIVLDKEFSSYIQPSQGLFSYQDRATQYYYQSPNLNVYDVYSNTSDYANMSNDQFKKLSQYGGLGQDYMFLLSWTLTGSVGSLNIEQIANTANGHLPGALYERISPINNKRPNIVYMDFINPKITQSIVKWNNS